METPVAIRVKKRRDMLRKAGLRPVQLWVPDTRQPSFRRECHRQSALLFNNDSEQEILDWLEVVADDEGWR